MSKPKTYRDYDPRRIELAESAWLTIWGCLGEWHQHLVLVGGLVPKYLCGDVKGPLELPRPATMDVDCFTFSKSKTICHPRNRLRCALSWLDHLHPVESPWNDDR